MLAALLLLADSAAHVTSGAVLTLVLPLGATIVVLFVWWYVAMHSPVTRTRSGTAATDAEPPVGSTPE
jgi:hypothetical protein